MLKKGILALFLLFFLFGNVSSYCEKDQININDASLEELDQLYGIGPAKAQAIIEARPFNSLEDLIKVKGIGEITLENIKTQDLACIEEEKNREKEKENIIEKEEIKNLSYEQEEEGLIYINEPIVLNTQNIKTQNYIEETSKNQYTIYGLIGFLILIVILFQLKRKKYKNEFRD